MQETAPRVRATILALALGAFAIGVSEFAAMGLLPYYAADLGVGEPRAGHAVSAYALGVVVGAPVLAILGARLSRRALLMGLIGAFALANALTAVAPDISTLTAARALSGLPHGAFLGIAMLLAANLLPPGRRSAGVAMVLMGLTVANVVGVPAAGAVGQAFGWRWCFAITAALAGISFVALWRVAPRDVQPADASPLREMSALANRAVWLTLLVGAVGFGGIFAVYAYLSAAMIEVSRAPAWAIPVALSAFGIGATLGNVIAGRLANWSQHRGALVLLVGMTIMPLVYATVLANWYLVVASVLLLGTTAGLVIPLQMRLMDVAGDGQALAAVLNHAAFNFANAIGPYFAGLALAAGYGYAATGVVGAALSVGGILALGIAVLASRRGPVPHGPGGGTPPIPAQ